MKSLSSKALSHTTKRKYTYTCVPLQQTVILHFHYGCTDPHYNVATSSAHKWSYSLSVNNYDSCLADQRSITTPKTAVCHIQGSNLNKGVPTTTSKTMTACHTNTTHTSSWYTITPFQCLWQTYLRQTKAQIKPLLVMILSVYSVCRPPERCVHLQ